MKSAHILFFLLIGCSISCKQQTKNESEYRLIRDNLYADEKGNLFIKAEDVSLAETSDAEERRKLTEVRWIDVVYCDTCKLISANEKIDGLAYLKDVVDTATFKFSKMDDEQGADLYEDKNHSYFHKHMADGGTITLFEK